MCSINFSAVVYPYKNFVVCINSDCDHLADNVAIIEVFDTIGKLIRSFTLQDIIAIEECDKEAELTGCIQKLCGIFLYSFRFKKNGKVQLKKYIFTNLPDDVRQNFLHIKGVLCKRRHNPHLMMFLNPHSGNGRCLKLFHSFLYLLFKIANIKLSIVICTTVENVANAFKLLPLHQIKQFDDVVISTHLRPDQFLGMLEHCHYTMPVDAWPAIEDFSLNNIDAADGVISVSGDGTFCDITRGLITRQFRRNLVTNDGMSTLSANGREVSCAADVPARIPWRVGVIPAGSTDALAHSMNDVHCPFRMAVAVVTKRTRRLDCQATFCRYSDQDGDKPGQLAFRTPFTMIGAGYFGEIVRKEKTYRKYVGKWRHISAGVTSVLNWKAPCRLKITLQVPTNGTAKVDRSPGIITNETGYDSTASDDNDAELTNAVAAGDCLSVKSGSDKDRASPAGPCHDLCGVCAVREMFGERHSMRRVSLDGEFSSFQSHLTRCRSRMSPAGISPTSHLGDGRTHVYAVRSSNAPTFLRTLSRSSKGDWDAEHVTDVVAKLSVDSASSGAENKEVKPDRVQVCVEHETDNETVVMSKKRCLREVVSGFAIDVVETEPDKQVWFNLDGEAMMLSSLEAEILAGYFEVYSIGGKPPVSAL